MMTQEQAAKYFIVAWVKDWPLRMYFDTVCGEKIDWSIAHEKFPWLPKNISFFCRNSRVRRYVAEEFRVLNDKLWDANNNEQRLKLAPIVEKCVGIGNSSRANDGKFAARKSAADMGRVVFAKKLTIEAMRAGRGTAWDVCK